jgi:hypothetical protein
MLREPGLARIFIGFSSEKRNDSDQSFPDFEWSKLGTTASHKQIMRAAFVALAFKQADTCLLLKPNEQRT